MKRKTEREIIVLTLYSIELSGNDIYDTVNYVLEQHKIEESASEFIIESVQGVINHKNRLDEVIQNNLEGYQIDRLSYIDLAIIRFATYELMMTKNIHFAVVINEAVELTKKYSDLGDNKATAFNNSVLDKIKNHLGYNEVS